MRAANPGVLPTQSLDRREGRCRHFLRIAAIALTALLCSIVALPADAHAQDDKQQLYLKYARALIKQYDANHDGMLDQSEVDKMRRPPNVDMGDDLKADEFELVELLSGKKYTGSRKNALYVRKRAQSEQAKPAAQQQSSPQASKAKQKRNDSISQAKYRAYAKSLFTQYDKNRDGQLDPAEVSRMRRPPKFDYGADGNLSGNLSEDEMVAYLLFGKTKQTPAKTNTPQQLDNPVRIRLGGSGMITLQGAPRDVDTVAKMIKELGQTKAKPALNSIAVEYWLLQTKSEDTEDFSFDGLSAQKVRQAMKAFADDENGSVDHAKFSMANGSEYRQSFSKNLTVVSSNRGRQRMSIEPDQAVFVADQQETDGQYRMQVTISKSVEVSPIELDRSDFPSFKVSSFNLQTSAIFEEGKSVCFGSDQSSFKWRLVVVVKGGNHAQAAR